MGDWSRVKWTQARQVAAAMGVREPERPAAGVTPAAHYAALRDDGDLPAAARFLGHALPRFEGVSWAARAIAAMPRESGGQAERSVLARIMHWLADPDDDGRRAIWALAEAADERSAERLLGAAIFFSGGSIAPEDLPAVQPAPEVSGRLAAAAVMIAARGTPDPTVSLIEALAMGEAIAADPKG